MSGGSYNYIYCSLSEECEGRMYDAEMNDMIRDLCSLLRSLEWWQSGDCCEESYRGCLSEFKKKWFKSDREERLRGYIDEKISVVRNELYCLIGLDEKEKQNETN